MTLKELRKDWEKGMTRLCEISSIPDTSYVVLMGDGFQKIGNMDTHNLWCCRYFRILAPNEGGPLKEEWHMSVDKKNVSYVEAFKWLEKNFKSPKV